MSAIRDLKTFIDTLNATDPAHYAQVVKRLDLAPEAFDGFAFWDADGYTRNCIERTDDYELILLCWSRGDRTPVHGHADQNCWVYQIDGTVHEVRYDLQDDGALRETDRASLEPGDLTYMHDAMGYHHIENVSCGRAMTMHIYAAPIDACEVYSDEANCFEVRSMEYHTMKGEEVLVD